MMEQVDREKLEYEQIIHRGAMYQRVLALDFVGARERALADEWEKLNRRVSGVNGGLGILEGIISDDDRTYTPITPRDAFIAATVIQWLGTACGRGFLDMAGKRFIRYETAMEMGRRMAGDLIGNMKI